MDQREGFKARNAKVIVLPKRDLNYKLKVVSNDTKKRFEFFRALAQEKTQTDMTYLLFFLRAFIVRFSLLMTSFQSIFWRLSIFFSRCSSLDFRLWSYAASCTVSRSSRRILPILASFLTFLRVFLDSRYSFYFFLSLVAFFMNLNYNNFLWLTRL